MPRPSRPSWASRSGLFRLLASIALLAFACLNAAPEAQAQDAAFMAAKVNTARFYADHILSKAPGIRDSIVEGAGSVTAMALDAF